MRLRHKDGQTIHIGYCTNVHPGEDLAEIVTQLDRYAVAVRQRLRAERLSAERLGVGLWLAAPVAAQLAADQGAVAKLRGELDARGLETVSCNGFPYQSFHAPVVKHAVYQPDWSTRERLDYTVDLARVLAGLLPPDAARGSVSTLPLAWRTAWTLDQESATHRHLDELAKRLEELHAETGRLIRIAFEPEPGCVVETTAQAIEQLSGVDTRYLGVCIDLAHLACAWEDPARAVASLQAAGLPVVKVQVSAALEASEPGETPGLRAYAEPRFLHQTRNSAGQATDDLSEALDAGLPGPWRVHFHVPLHAAPEPPLTATIGTLRAGLAALAGGPTAACDHFEVETYTWDVLPAGRRPAGPAELADGLAGELRFTADELLALGLTEPEAEPEPEPTGPEPAR